MGLKEQRTATPPPVPPLRTGKIYSLKESAYKEQKRFGEGSISVSILETLMVVDRAESGGSHCWIPHQVRNDESKGKKEN